MLTGCRPWAGIQGLLVVAMVGTEQDLSEPGHSETSLSKFGADVITARVAS